MKSAGEMRKAIKAGPSVGTWLIGALLYVGGGPMAAAEGNQTLALLHMLNGGIVNNAETALKIAEIITGNVYGQDELSRQRTLTATDRGDSWLVEGSYNRDRRMEGPGPMTILIRKRDAQVLELDLPVVVHVPPEVGRPAP